MLSVMDFLVKNECEAPILLGYDLCLLCRDAIYKVLRYRSSFDIELKVGVIA